MHTSDPYDAFLADESRADSHESPTVPYGLPKNHGFCSFTEKYTDFETDRKTKKDQKLTPRVCSANQNGLPAVQHLPTQVCFGCLNFCNGGAGSEENTQSEKRKQYT